MVTHDRYFLERVVSKIIELENGKLYEYNANYSKYLELKEERLETLASIERKIETFLRKETEWIKRGARARSTKEKKRPVLQHRSLVQKTRRVLEAAERRLLQWRLRLNLGNFLLSVPTTIYHLLHTTV